jgi:hypothetical protein
MSAPHHVRHNKQAGGDFGLFDFLAVRYNVA